MLLIERLTEIASRALTETDEQFAASVREFLAVGTELNACGSPEPVDENLLAL